MSERVYVAVVLFFILLSFLALAFDVDTEIKNWLFLRAQRKRNSNVSEEAERTGGSQPFDLWEEIMQENQEEMRQQLEARERDERTWEEIRRIRDDRFARQEHIRQAREEMSRQQNTTQTNSTYHNATSGGFYNMGSWNMADSPRPTEAPASYHVGDIVKLEFPPREQNIPGDYSWQRPRQTLEGLLHGQHVILGQPDPRNDDSDLPRLWNCSILNAADCPPNLIGERLLLSEKYFIKKPAPAVVYPKKVQLKEGGLPKL